MNVRDNLAAGKYENKVPYSIDKIPVDENTMTVKQAREHTESEKQRSREQTRKHRENEGVMSAAVKSDLEAQEGLVGHPKADLLWSIAWERGHSSGYSDVISVYEEMAELLI